MSTMFDLPPERIFDQKKIKKLITDQKELPSGRVYYWETGGDTFLRLMDNKDDPKWVELVNREGMVVLGDAVAGRYLKKIYDKCEFRFIGFRMTPLMDSSITRLKKPNPTKEFFCLSAVRSDRAHRQRFKTHLESKGLDALGFCRFQSGDQDDISYEDLQGFYPKKMLQKVLPAILPSVGYYNSTKYEIVIETFGHHPDDDSFMMSEKIFKSIIMKHPFMVVTTKNFLGNMRQMGFRTFENFIDQSYDTARTEQEKFDIITDNIRHLSTKESSFHARMNDICEHNYNHFVRMQKIHQQEHDEELEKIKNED